MKDLSEFIKESENWFQKIMESIQKYASKLEKSEKWFSTVLKSIGDAVIVTNESGFIQFLNPVAEKLTGWNSDSAFNKPLRKVFHIINEDTREPLENPVTKVIHKKIVIGLANHTILISKDGREIPIDDSGAPITNDEGNIIGIVLVFRDISERRKAEKLIESSEVKYRNLFDQASIGVFVHDLEGTFIDANQKMQTLFGYDEDEIKSLKFSETHPLNTKAQKLGKEKFQEVIQNGNDHFKTLFKKKDGTVFYGEVTSKIISYGEKKLIQGTIQNITESIKNEREIKHINNVLKAIRNVNQIIIREIDREVLIKKICENLTKTRGFLSAWLILFDSKNRFLLGAESGIGDVFNQLIHQFKRGEFSKCCKITLKEKGVFTIKDPESFCMDCPISVIYDERNVLSVKLKHSDTNYGVLVVSIPKNISNITEEKSLLKEVADDIAFALNKIEIQEKKTQSEYRYTELYESMMDAYVSVDMEGKIIEFNQQYLDMLGYSEEEVKNLTYLDITPSKWHEFEKEIVNKQVLRKGYSEVYEKEYIKKDGTILPVEIRTFLLKNEMKNPKGMWAIVRDISVRRENEAKLRKSKHDLKERYKELSCLYSLTDLGRDLNKPLEELFQESLLLFKATWQFPEITQIKINFDSKIYKTENFNDTSWKLQIKKNFGGHNLSVEIVYNENKQFLQEEIDLLDEIGKRLVSIIKHREFEQKIIKSEKQYREAYNRAEFYKDLFAHDIKNILQSILSGLELNQYIVQNEGDTNLVNENLKIIKNQILRGVQLVSNVRKFSQLENQTILRRNIEIYKIVKAAVDSLKLIDFNREVNIDIYIADKNLKVMGDDFLADVFDIILTNSVRHNKNQEVEITINISERKMEDMNYVQIEFIDNGIGIEDARKSDIFSRGYTENKSIYGMGLGLSLATRIIKNYNGKIWVEDKIENESSKGSKFIVLIPEGGYD
ncbi:MAG: PAS domain S-box protein [Candidatus Lokiarchaeota archaeon]|nr:PAS domain S-box protein [Candidatus Lokiarchaeota archaeon]MBD3211250.1 PAS domain S-box protein [Candidatus Lokiarchaeota archaeon]